MKKTTACCINLFIGLLFILFASYTKAQETPIKITDIRSGKGKIILNVFKDNDSYDKNQPYKKFTFDKKALINGTLTVHVEIEPGVYGITLVDDENEDGKINKNFVGIPKEGFGFSNFFMTKMKKPSFDDFKVDLKSTEHKVDIKVKYM
ncbi:DUF2141 domain-containing protein [Mucilaginibacter lappiensis]|uniref:Uncharacterized protein (DUF2141 family) n=1 Tax=Mucilaginibacter lappiensis TaxID=354630 RepID=A0A1N7ETA1_9SPHI|nr:DUF2141 domain-containing protein [Mucilaginibacter lappiensis]MBB6111974.1 uncharacterized protein (DUF2141 family) [Mucilaginibacter lappiensis]MBB6126507.1 uncharacterized protein (DUF2141 family) [Mucilaginibacter lappiensis]SIR91259.1 Uncharacterized conserved protein, DUF2141 family [Mucilaginibacter lappiensis]